MTQDDWNHRFERLRREQEQWDRDTAWMRAIDRYLYKWWVLIPLIFIVMIGGGLFGYAIVSWIEPQPQTINVHLNLF